MGGFERQVLSLSLYISLSLFLSLHMYLPSLSTHPVFLSFWSSFLPCVSMYLLNNHQLLSTFLSQHALHIASELWSAMCFRPSSGSGVLWRFGLCKGTSCAICDWAIRGALRFKFTQAERWAAWACPLKTHPEIRQRVLSRHVWGDQIDFEYWG